MQPVVDLDKRTISVIPGQTALVEVQIRNTSDIVEAYRVEVLGELRHWARVTPSDVEVMPGSGAKATIVLSPPPEPAGMTGNFTLGVRVFSTNDRIRSTVEEADVAVTGQAAVSLEVSPNEVQGRREGIFQVSVKNPGTETLTLRLRASDPGAHLRYKFQPPVLTVPPGQLVFSTLQVAPPLTTRGKEIRHQIEVAVGEHESGTPEWAPFSPRARQGVTRTAAATFVQRPAIPKGAIRLAGLAAIGLLGFIAYKTVQPGSLKAPAVTPTAEDAVAVEFSPAARAHGSYLVWTYKDDGATKTDAKPVEVTPNAPAGGSGRLGAAISQLTPGRHCFRVEAKGRLGTSKLSPPGCADLAIAQLDAPQELTSTLTADPTRVQLSWKGDPALKYRLFRDNRPDGELVSGLTTTVDAKSLSCFTVQAVDEQSKKFSGPSNKVCAGGPVYEVTLYAGVKLPPGSTPESMPDDVALAFGVNRDQIKLSFLQNAYVVKGPTFASQDELTKFCSSQLAQSWIARPPFPDGTRMCTWNPKLPS